MRAVSMGIARIEKTSSSSETEIEIPSRTSGGDQVESSSFVLRLRLLSGELAELHGHRIVGLSGYKKARGWRSRTGGTRVARIRTNQEYPTLQWKGVHRSQGRGAAGRSRVNVNAGQLGGGYEGRNGDPAVHGVVVGRRWSDSGWFVVVGGGW